MIRPKLTTSFRRNLTASVAIAGLLAAPFIATPSVVDAAFPGYNGKISLVSDVDGNLEIYATNVGSSTPANLTNHPANDRIGIWSPDGTQLVFTSKRDAGTYEIYVMKSDRSSLQRITNNSSEDFGPEWSPDGGKIIFSRITSGSNQDILVINVDGTDEINLTNSPSISESNPTWSPDGSRIAFSSNQDGNNDIYVMDGDGANEVNITNNPAGDGGATWSPDGQRIAFDSNRGGSYDIFTMTYDGADLQQLTTDSGVDAGAAWSPDGNFLAFVSNRSGSYLPYVMNRDGTAQTVASTLSLPTPEAVGWQPIPNTAPIATSDSLTTQYNTSGSLNVLANDKDEEALDPNNLTITSQPTQGTASIVDDKVTYTPNDGYIGDDQLTYQICDSFLLDQKCTTGVLGITVQAPGAPTVTLNTIGNTTVSNGVTTYTSNSARPTFSGSATPGAAIRVEITSDPIILTTTADDGGKWSVTPDRDIPAGEHTVTITATKDDVTTTLDVFVLGITAGTAAAEVPKTGATTSALRLWGVGLLAGGAGLHLRYRRQPRRSDGYVPRLFP